MRALVIYESMYGDTRAVATGIAAGLGAAHEVTLVPVTRATPELVATAGLTPGLRRLTRKVCSPRPSTPGSAGCPC
jgi:hypothetical protein